MSLYIRVLVGLVAFTVLGVDDKSSKMPLLLAYSPVAQPRAGRANQNPPKGGRVGARKSGTAAVSGKVSADTSATASSAAAALAPESVGLAVSPR